MNTVLVEVLVSLMLPNLDRPIGKALVRTGRGLQAVGEDVEALGHRVIKDEPIEKYRRRNTSAGSRTKGFTR